MELAEVEWMLGSGMQKILRLSEAPKARVAEAADDAFEEFRAGVRAARGGKAADLLSAFAPDDMRKALMFLQQRTVEKKMQKRLTQECLKILLVHSGWCSVARKHPSLRESLSEYISSDGDALSPVKQQLGSKIATAASKACPPNPKDAQGTEVRRLVYAATDAMRGLEWNFLNTRGGFDVATDACRNLYQAMNKLRSLYKSLEDLDAGRALVASVGGVCWDDVLRFLLSMHESGYRRAWHSRIIFTSATLEQYSLEYEAAVHRGAPPWRPPASPAEEAAAATAEAAEQSPAASDAEEQALGAVAEHVDDVSTKRFVAFELDAQVQPSEEPQQPLKAASRKLQAGCIGFLNSASEDLIFYVEELEEEFRLRSGEDLTLNVRREQVTVRINRVGFLGFASFRTRLARLELEHQRIYNVTLFNGCCYCLAV